VTVKELEDMTTEGHRGERATGTANTIYDLSSVLFHALEGGASYDQYIHDAEEAGDQELADFFRRVRDEDSMRADEAQLLLAERTPTGARTEGGGAAAEGVAAGAPPTTEPAGVAPITEPAGARPGLEQEPPPRTGEPLPPRPEERPLGSEGVMPPTRPEEAPPRTGEAPPRTEGAALPEEHERARQPEREREEDRGLIDRALDKLTGEEEHRREGPDRPGQR
jgi:hypothetical protein